MTPTITVRPMEPTNSKRPVWVICRDGREIAWSLSRVGAERYADNLREQLLGEPDDEPTWSTKHTRSALGLLVLIVVLALLGFCTQARAAEGYTVGLHLATAHFGGHDLRGDTPGLYGRINSGPLEGATVGTFRNSYGDWSTYAGWSDQTDDKRFAITLAGITGYSPQRVMPLVVPSVRVPLWRTTALRVAYIPKPRKQGKAHGLHLSTELEF